MDFSTFVCLVIFTVYFQTFYFVSDLDFVKKAVGLDYKCDVRFDALDLDTYIYMNGIPTEQSVCLVKQKIIISI